MKKLILSIALLAIFSCKENTKTTDSITSDPALTTKSSEDSGVKIEEIKKDEPRELNSIQKKSLNDVVANITKVRVTGDILTVEMIVENIGKERISYYLPLKEISYIDDATSKKYSLLQDDEGKYMADPINSTSRDIAFYGEQREHLISMKFPAPPAESKTISLNIPKFGSFDVLPVSR